MRLRTSAFKGTTDAYFDDVTAQRMSAEERQLKTVRQKAMVWTPPTLTASMCQFGRINQSKQPVEESKMNIKRVGIDLAKQVFQVHGVDCHDKAVLRKQLRRNQFLGFFATLSPCLIGMEACGGAHHWARELQKQGHTVKLIAPQFVKPYVKSNKNDANDAEAICEAVGRPSMRFVTIKTVAQQDLQAIHRIRR